jgi:hypothetical protein
MGEEGGGSAGAKNATTSACLRWLPLVDVAAECARFGAAVHGAPGREQCAPITSRTPTLVIRSWTVTLDISTAGALFFLSLSLSLTRICRTRRPDLWEAIMPRDETSSVRLSPWCDLEKRKISAREGHQYPARSASVRLRDEHNRVECDVIGVDMRVPFNRK